MLIQRFVLPLFTIGKMGRDAAQKQSPDTGFLLQADQQLRQWADGNSAARLAIAWPTEGLDKPALVETFNLCDWGVSREWPTEQFGHYDIIQRIVVGQIMSLTVFREPVQENKIALFVLLIVTQ